jgi:hypothetical protein
MEILRTARLHRCGIRLASTWEQCPKHRDRAHEWQRVRSLCIRKIFSIHPRATLIDLYIQTSVLLYLFEGELRKEEELAKGILSETADRSIEEMAPHTKNSSLEC